MNRVGTRYPKYRDTGYDWLLPIPAHWEIRRSRFVFRETDQRSADGHETHLSMTQSHGLIPSRDLDRRRLHSASYTGGKLVRAGDLVLNRLKAHLGVFAGARQPGTVSPDYSVFRSLIDRPVEYYEKLFKTTMYVGELRRSTRGIVEGFWRLYTDDFYNIPALLPPREEQDQIVAYLRAQDAQIARFIRDKRRLIEVLNEQKQTLIQRAVTLGLDPKARLKPSGIEWLGEVPEHWFARRLKFVADNVTEQTDSQRNDEIYLALEHVESWTGKMSPPQGAATFSSTVKRFKKNDVLFGKLRPYLAKVVRPQVSGICVSEFFVLRIKDAEVLPAYLELLLRTKKVIEIVNSSTAGAKMPRADWAAVGNLRLAFPPKTEQLRVLSAIAEETISLDVASEQAKGEITLMQKYRDRLVADVVTGQLDVRGWVPGPDDVIGKTAALLDDADETMGEQGAEDDDDGHE